MMRPPVRFSSGFTLIEVLVAMAILLLGMTGIFAVFATAQGLQREAAERFDVALDLSAIASAVRDDLAAELGGRAVGNRRSLDGQVFPVPGDPRYRYRVSLQPMPDDPEGRGFFCRIEILARYRGEDRVYDMGYRPIIPEPDNDRRIEELLGSGSTNR